MLKTMLIGSIFHFVEPHGRATMVKQQPLNRQMLVVLNCNIEAFNVLSLFFLSLLLSRQFHMNIELCVSLEIRHEFMLPKYYTNKNEISHS